jgi:drug/metabolite transporter (DMT)-like permease
MLHSGAVIAVVILGIGTTVAFVVNYWLIARVGPVQASLAFYLIPPVAVAGGVLLRDERLSGNQTLGFILICLALAFLYLWERLVASRPRPLPVEHSSGTLTSEQAG